MQSPPFLRIGTRGSPLALVQARLVRARLAHAHGISPEAIEIVVISTSGDRLTDRPLSEAGGKGLFTREIEAALLDGRIDLGVHSTKDMSSVLPEGLVLAAFLEREDVRDAFVSLSAPSLEALPQGARLGTSSIRRAAQMRRVRPDLEVVPFRGNVETRLRKLESGVADATLLAVAGLNRLDARHRITAILDPARFPPAPAQGAIGIEIRIRDSRTAERVAVLDHPPTHTTIRAERAMLLRLDGSCRTPIGVRTGLENGRLSMTGELLSPDGRQVFEAAVAGPDKDAVALGTALGDELRGRAGQAFFDALAVVP